MQAVGDRTVEATTLSNIGAVYDALGEKQQALKYYNQALPISQAVGDRAGEATTLNNIGLVYSDLGEEQQALKYYNQALPILQAVGDRAGEATTLYNIADLERSRGNLKEALTNIEASLKIIETLRKLITSEQLRASYFATVQDNYKFYIDLLMELHKNNPSSGFDGKALQASETARARNLLDILTESRADIRTGVNPNLLQQERSLQQQLSALEQRRVQILRDSHTPEQEKALQEEVETLLKQYEEVQTQIRVTSPGYAALTQPQPLTLQQIQSTLLDENTLLLEYSLGEERSYLWAVSKNGISSYELAKGADIEAAAKKYYDLLKIANKAVRERNAAETTAAAAKLSDMLLKPVAGQLGKKRLLIVSDGTLQYIPFAALPVPARETETGFLNSEHEIVYLPSASTLGIIRKETSKRQPAAKTIAVLADPVFTTNDLRVKLPPSQVIKPSNNAPSTNTSNIPTPPDVSTGLEIPNLPEIPIELRSAARDLGIAFNRLEGTRTEAQKILALVPDSEEKQAFDFAANRATAVSTELSEYKIVHFATHGILNSERPELSGVVLSLVDEKGTPQNGFLRLNDIYNMKLPAELVVLSACETGLGKEVKGEGLVSLTRGFMYAGAKRVVVSLWKVDDDATAELMTRFYTKMLKEKLPPAAALRAAQIEMSQQSQWKDPYYWAAFVMQGEYN